MSVARWRYSRPPIRSTTCWLKLLLTNPWQTSTWCCLERPCCFSTAFKSLHHQVNGLLFPLDNFSIRHNYSACRDRLCPYWTVLRLTELPIHQPRGRRGDVEDSISQLSWRVTFENILVLSILCETVLIESDYCLWWQIRPVFDQFIIFRVGTWSNNLG